MADNNNSSEIVTEDSSWGSDKTLSQRQLILLLIKKINDESFKKAENLTVDTGKAVTVLDIRETRCNGIRDLFTLLQPNFDEKMKTEAKKFKEALSKLDKHFWEMSLKLFAYAKTERIHDPVQKEQEIKNWENKFKGSGYMFSDKSSPEYSGYLDSKHNYYQNLFEEIIYQLDRISWLTGSGGINE